MTSPGRRNQCSNASRRVVPSVENGLPSSGRAERTAGGLATFEAKSERLVLEEAVHTERTRSRP